MGPSTEPNVDHELAAAEHALRRGELSHAAHHLAVALLVAPARREGQDLINRLIAAVPEPLELAPFDQMGYAGTAALRACILARQGQLSDAVWLVLQVVMAKPDGAFLDWLIPWLRQAPAEIHLDLDQVNHFLGWVLLQYPGNVIDDASSCRFITQVLAFIDASLSRLPTDQKLLYARVSFLRKVKRLDEALTAAEELYRIFPGYFPAAAVGMVYQARGDRDQWHAWYQKALEYDPQSVPHRLEFGDRFWEFGQLDRAEAWYEEALRLEPSNEWALPSLYCVRFLRTRDPQWRERLDDLVLTQPTNQRARDLCQRITPFVGFLPEPADLIVNFARMLLEKLRQDPRDPIAQGTLRVSVLEAPSAHLALALALGKEPDIAYEVEAIQSPDPRRPRVPVDYVLWRYKDTKPVAAVREPSGDVVAAVSEIARTVYHLLAWSRQARSVAARLGPSCVTDLLGVMVHPPAPEEIPAWVWLGKVQIAAALVLAHIDEGWWGSVRQKVLYALANGPMDWTVSAGIVALTALALDDPVIEAEVRILFSELMYAIPQLGYTCWAYPLVCCYLHLPNITDEERTILRQWRNGLEKS